MIKHPNQRIQADAENLLRLARAPGQQSFLGLLHQDRELMSRYQALHQATRQAIEIGMETGEVSRLELRLLVSATIVDALLTERPDLLAKLKAWRPPTETQQRLNDVFTGCAGRVGDPNLEASASR